MEHRQPLQNPSSRPRGKVAANGAHASCIDWPAWLRIIERKRRLLTRLGRRRLLAPEFYAAATFVSFRLERMAVTEAEVAQCLMHGPSGRSFRSRLVQRLRNHAAILRHIESSLRIGESLKGSTVLRWYTSISSGLSMANLDNAMMNRLDLVVRRINSPQLRLQPALVEIARLHSQLMLDPIMPGFNGILARLLIRYHLGRCGLPPVLFDPENDLKAERDESLLLPRLLVMIGDSYDMLLTPTI